MRRTSLFSHLILLFTLHGASAFAQPPELVPPKTIQEIIGSHALTTTKVEKVKTARILLADYELIKKDFPGVAHKTHAEIDQWLLQNMGYISTTQSKLGNLQKTNSPIKTDLTELKTAYRPYLYDRALVFSVNGSFMDMKGAGAINPKPLSHANGLMETSEAVREYFFTKAVKDIFQDAKAKYNVVDSYGVIDWGFHQYEIGSNPSAEKIPQYRSGAILRQAHVRDLSTFEKAEGQLSNEITVDVEKILRRYGVTSALPRKIKVPELYEIDALNIQGTLNNQFIYDFGSFRVEKKFRAHAMSLQDWAHAQARASILFSEGNAEFPKIDPHRHLNYELWNGSTSSAEEKIWLESRKISKMLDDGVPLEKVRAHTEALLKQYRNFEPAPAPVNSCLGFLNKIF